jgi:hypothetical protein
MSDKKKYIIDILNIKYCTCTIIYNESQDLMVQTSRFLNWFGYENKIVPTDTIILEHDNQIIELDSKYIIDKDIKYKYFSYGISADIFPKSIQKEITDRKNLYLSYIEPELLDNKYINKYIKKVFIKYPQKVNHKSSEYCSTYSNIYNDTIVLGITKINYSNNNSSRYAIGYDSTILDFEEVKSILKEIFIK